MLVRLRKTVGLLASFDCGRGMTESAVLRIVTGVKITWNRRSIFVAFVELVLMAVISKTKRGTSCTSNTLHYRAMAKRGA